MAALLIGMSVAAVLVTVAMPAWKQMVQREKEAELVFRGQQYVRAIGLFQKKSGPGVLPPSLDVLITGRFLRKKYKDPVTNKDFDLLSPTAGAGQPGQPAAGQGRGGSAQPPSGRGNEPNAAGSVVGAQAGGRGATGGIIGVASSSKDASIRLYNGRTHYNEWQFIYVQQVQAPGAGAPGVPGGAGRGGNGAGGTAQRGSQPPAGAGQSGPGRQGPGQERGIGPQGPQPGGRGPQPVPSLPAPNTSPFQPRR
jgi:type II secretory pathway pseudopilin PulG